MFKFTNKIYNSHSPNSENREERLTFLTEELEAIRQKKIPFEETISMGLPLSSREKQELQNLKKDEEVFLKKIESEKS